MQSLIGRPNSLDIHHGGNDIEAPLAIPAGLEPEGGRDFKPELVLLSAGFDSRLGDPLGQFTLSDPDFAALTVLMLEVAHQHAGGRLERVDWPSGSPRRPRRWSMPMRWASCTEMSSRTLLIGH